MRKLLVILILFPSCISPYDFRPDDSPGYLVVEGYVSNKAGDSEIRLSRSGLFQVNVYDQVSDAVVVVIENETIEHPWVYHGDGLYKPEQEDFFAKKESTYYLRIIQAGQVYESEPVHLPNSLDIENLSFESVAFNQDGDPVENPRLNLHITTSNDEDASRYYMYTFEETWLNWARYSLDKIVEPIFIYHGYEIKNIEFETTYYDNITYCWPSNKVVGINIQTSEGLSSNQFLNLPIFSFSLESPKLLYTYSVLVNQYAISREVHHFFNMLKEFSENAGYLYDIQPGFIEGNIYNTNNPEEFVIGVFYAANHSSSRKYKFFSDLSREEKYIVLRHKPKCKFIQYTYPNITADSLLPDEDLNNALLYLRDSLIIDQGLYILDNYFLEGLGPVVDLTNGQCISCLGSGTNEKPSWWDVPLPIE
ncbi:MAG TPA: DUF4249 domain-containing protein [Bacteroides sp.]|nr:DUF4249 domain-containing protein [Bacteroides sp.]